MAKTNGKNNDTGANLGFEAKLWAAACRTPATARGACSCQEFKLEEHMNA